MCITKVQPKDCPVHWNNEPVPEKDMVLCTCGTEVDCRCNCVYCKASSGNEESQKSIERGDYGLQNTCMCKCCVGD